MEIKKFVQESGRSLEADRIVELKQELEKRLSVSKENRQPPSFIEVRQQALTLFSQRKSTLPIQMAIQKCSADVGGQVKAIVSSLQGTVSIAKIGTFA